MIYKILCKLGLEVINIRVAGLYYRNNDVINVGTPFEYVVIGINETDSTYEIVDDAYFSHVPFIIKYSNYFIL